MVLRVSGIPMRLIPINQNDNGYEKDEPELVLARGFVYCQDEMRMRNESEKYKTDFVFWLS